MLWLALGVTDRHRPFPNNNRPCVFQHARQGGGMAADEEEEYDFEYSDDDEAEPDVEVSLEYRGFEDVHSYMRDVDVDACLGRRMGRMGGTGGWVSPDPPFVID